MPKAHIVERQTEAIEKIRGSLVDLRRLLQRRDVAKLWAAAFGRETRLDYTELRLLDAVRVADPDGGATIGDVARRLGIDPSRASRQVARAIDDGLLVRHAEQKDGRKVRIRITRAGSRLQKQGSELTRARIGLALAGWSAADCEQFATLLTRFGEAMSVEDTPPSRRQTRR